MEFSPEDATRTDPDFLCQMVAVAIDAGATIINLPDTVGYSVPAEYGAMFEMLRSRVPQVAGITLSSHCHNDLGMAVANTLAAVRPARSKSSARSTASASGQAMRHWKRLPPP